MAEFLGSIWWLLVVLGVLVTFHEFGHYWVARRLGVHVQRFSVGFGRALWSRRGRDGTEYVVAAIPLGGYVKMLDEREDEVPPEQVSQAFNRQPVWARMAIIAAGPVFNFIFAVLAFWVMFMVGTPEARPIVGEASGIAAEAGLERGDQFVAIDGRRTQTWTHTMLGMVTSALDREPVTLTVEDRDGRQRQLTLPLDQLGDDFREEETFASIGIRPWRAEVPPVVGEVSPDSPAEAAGLRPGDRIVSVAGEETPSWGWIGARVREHGRAGEPLAVTVERDGATRQLDIAPEKLREGWFSSRLILGISAEPPGPELEAEIERGLFLLRYGPVEGLGAAVGETWRLTGATLGMIGRMITGTASLRNLTSPIGIAQLANDSAAAGLSSFLFFLGLISLSLAVLNLLPIPVLDGGQLVYCAIEAVTGKPLSLQAQAAGQYIGLLALVGVMCLAVFNDILRLVG